MSDPRDLVWPADRESTAGSLCDLSRKEPCRLGPLVMLLVETESEVDTDRVVLVRRRRWVKLEDGSFSLTPGDHRGTTSTRSTGGSRDAAMEAAANAVAPSARPLWSRQPDS